MQLDKRVGSESAGAPSPILFHLNPGSGVPTYRQLVQQVENALRLGYLSPQDRLPKVREVVADLAINPNTVLKAYRELEHKGLVTGRPGQGTFVTGTLNQVGLPAIAGLRRTLRSWLAESTAAGLDEDAVVALFSSTLRDFRERPEDTGPDVGLNRAGRAGGGVA